MGNPLLKLYHRLPPPARDLAASLRGWQLRRWRYGPESERLAEEAVEREHWGAEEWRAYQLEALTRLLHRAATRVPFYRDAWSRRRQAGDRASWEYLENWPVLTKRELRENPRAFVADDCDPARMFLEQTSGTTGTPLSLWWSRETVRRWSALAEVRLRRWHGATWREPWAILGGQPVIPASARKPPFWVWNSALHQLYLSSNHLSRQNLPYYLEAMERHGVTHLIAYTSSAAVLASDALEQGAAPPSKLRVVVTNAEPLFAWQREQITRGLGVPVRESYGMAEIVAAASECPEGTLHAWPEVGWIEALEDDLSTPSLGAGQLVCTGLMNADMPLIRYLVGDRSETPHATLCACGRSLPALSSIEGRSNDLLLARDGRRVFWLNPVFYGIPLREAQVVQESLDRVRVRLVPAAGFGPADEASIRERFHQRLGPVEVLFETVAEIPRGANGKFKAIVCDLSPEERAEVLGS